MKRWKRVQREREVRVSAGVVKASPRPHPAEAERTGFTRPRESPNRLRATCWMRGWELRTHMCRCQENTECSNKIEYKILALIKHDKTSRE